jgi:hypothetical protein
MTEYVVNYATGGTITPEQAKKIGKALDRLERCMIPKTEKVMEKIMTYTYEVTLDSGDRFTIVTDADIDNLHQLLVNEDDLVMFELYDGARVLIRSTSIVALWEA